MAKVIGIVGSRSRDSALDYRKVFDIFNRVFKEGDSIVSGGCPMGADRFAVNIAKTMGVSITIHFPNWPQFGKRAGFIRNTKIADQADVLIACVSSDRKGGTEDTIKKFKDEVFFC